MAEKPAPAVSATAWITRFTERAAYLLILTRRSASWCRISILRVDARRPTKPFMPTTQA